MAKTQRLDKILVHMGYGSRKDIRGLCKAGVVTVDGDTVKDSSQHVDPASNIIKVGEEVVQYREFVYLMMNKPQDVISATEDLKHKTVIDLLASEYKSFSVFPVGRLDIDTEGLLLLTNDGQLAHQLLSPKRHVAKVYYARIMGRVTLADQLAIEAGVTLDDGYRTLPGQLNIVDSGEVSEIELTIYEGKFHQVKRMFEALGKQVIYLKRVSMGPLSLDPDLELGSYRELTNQELAQLKEDS